LRSASADIGKRTEHPAVELRDIDLLFSQEPRHFPKRFPRERDVEGQQWNIDPVDAYAIDNGWARGRGQNHDVMSGELEVASQIVHLHLDATKARHIAIRDQRDFESPRHSTIGRRGVGHTTPQDGGRTPFTVVLTVAL
jgi:hypothetical protein